MDKYDTLLADLIAKRTNKTIDFVKSNWLNFEDNYFTPEEAKEAGLIDVIESYQAKNIPSNVKLLNPDQLAAFYQDETPNMFQKILTSVKNTITKNEPNMNKFKKLMTIGIIRNEDETEPQTEQAEDEIASLKQENETLKAENEVLKTENEALKKEVESLKAELGAASEPPSALVAPADVIHGSANRPSFETSIDRELKAAFRNY